MTQYNQYNYNPTQYRYHLSVTYEIKKQVYSSYNCERMMAQLLGYSYSRKMDEQRKKMTLVWKFTTEDQIEGAVLELRTLTPQLKDLSIIGVDSEKKKEYDNREREDES